MEIEIKAVKVGELLNFCNSSSFKEFEFEPISRYRALSYAANPRANAEDVAILLAIINNKLVGYLGMFADVINHKQQNIKFCWFSCMWVLPEFRRSGVAILLLKEGYNAFKGFVMITNYIPRSKAAFLKTKQYKELDILNGFRFYIKADLRNIFIRKYPSFKFMSWPFTFMDLILNGIISSFSMVKYSNKESDYTFQYIDHIDNITDRFIKEFADESLFQRSTSEIEWMIKYPWIKDRKDPDINYSKYYFSQYSGDFCQWFVNIRNKQEQLIGFMILTRHKGELKTPYVFMKEDISKDLGIFISNFISKNRIRTVITYSQSIIHALESSKKFLFKRKSAYGFLATYPLYELLNPLQKKIYEGDGDGAFT